MTILKSDKLVARILNRRGNRVNLPQPLEPGELGWCLDTKQLFVGLDSQNAIAAIQAFSGVVDADVNTVLNNDVVMFTTPYIRLLTPAVETNSIPDEKAALEKLSQFPPSSFLLENNRYAINALESKIRIISQFRSLIPSLIGAGNYPVTYLYDVETASPVTATATATLNAGAIDTVTVTNHGLGYFNGEVPIVTVVGDGVDGEVSALVDNQGNITLTIVDPGTGYTNITLTISAPQTITEMTTELYRFNFIVGVDNSYTTMSTFITDLNDDTSPTMMFVQCDEDINGYQIAFYTAGIAGTTLGMQPYNYVMNDGILYLPSVRRSTNLAGIINKLESGTGLVTTKQNVEILTEYSSDLLATLLQSILESNMLSYKLPPSPTYVNIENDGSDPLYDSTILQYDVFTTDVQIIDYSLMTSDKKVLRTGKLSVKTLDTGVSVLDDEFTENRDPSITSLAMSGPDFSFNYTYSLGTLTLTYSHNFATDVYLRISTRLWNSFVL